MPKSFDDDFITMKDPYSEETVNVPSNLEGFIKNLVKFNRHKGAEKSQSEMDELQEKIDAMNSELEEARKVGSGSTKEIESIKAAHQKELKKLADQVDGVTKQAGDNENRYYSYRMKSELLSKLPLADLHNVDDTLEKIQRSAKWVKRVDSAKGEPTGEVDLVLTLPVKGDNGKSKVVDYAPEDGIKAFLSDPANLYLLKNKLSPGSQQSQTPGQSGTITLPAGMTQMSRADYNKLPLMEQAKIMAEGKVTLAE